MVSSVGSGSLTVEVVMAVSVQSRASCSGILVNSDFTSKDTSLWSSGICAVLIASIKFSVDCSLCLDWSVTVTNSSFQNYTHPDDHTTRTTDTPGFKPFTINNNNDNNNCVRRRRTHTNLAVVYVGSTELHGCHLLSSDFRLAGYHNRLDFMRDRE